MSKNVAQNLIASYLVEGGMRLGEEVGLKIDQTLTQNETYETEHPMTPRQVEMILAGSLINLVRQKSHNLEYP